MSRSGQSPRVHESCHWDAPGRSPKSWRVTTSGTSTTDPSRAIRGFAIRSVALLCDDDQALIALESLPARRRRRLAVWLARRRRHRVVDRFIARGKASPRVLRELLPLASDSVVAGHLDLFDDGSDEDWKRLVGRHPETSGRALLQRVEQEAPPDPRLVWLANAATERLAPMISASSGRVLIAVLVPGMTRLTNCSTVLRSCGTWSSSSPSAVCTRRGRTPFRDPRALGVRSYRSLVWYRGRPCRLALQRSRDATSAFRFPQTHEQEVAYLRVAPS